MKNRAWTIVISVFLCCLVAGSVGAVLPSGNGRTTMAKSISVAIASDQAALPISGTVTATIDTSTLATSAKQDTGNTSLSSLDTKLSTSNTNTSSIDGKFPAAAAFNDNLANPTSTFLRVAPSCYDSASNNWDGGRCGQTSAQTPFGFLNVLAGGIYNSSDPAATTGQSVPAQVTPKGHLKVAMAFLFNNISTATTTTVKSGVGVLHSIVINKHIASNAITIYDNTAGSGTTIATITPAAALTTDPPITAIYDLAFTTGLTVVTAGASNITVTYQ